MSNKAQADFASILDMPATDVERPKPLPEGTYFGIIQGMYETGESSKKKTPFVRFTYAVQSVGEDVSEDDIKAFGDEGVIGKTVKDTYYTTPDALFRLIDMLENADIDLEGKSIRAGLDETPNCSIGFYIGHRASEDGESVFAEIKKTFKPE